jgi:RHS repeat-associated protein
MGDENLSTDPIRGHQQYDAYIEAWRAVEESYAKSGLSEETLLLIQKYTELEIRVYGYELTKENFEGTVQSSIAALQSPNGGSTEFDENSAIYIDIVGGRVAGHATQRAIASDKGSEGNTDKKGDPVELFSGEFAHTCDDLFIKGAGIDFVFRRNYRNQALYDGPLGSKWDHIYNIWIWRWSTGTILIRSTGDLREEVYRRHPKFGQAGFSYYVPPNGQAGTISELGSSFVWRSPNGIRYLFEQDPSTPAYHRLVRIEDQYGNFLAFSYQDRRLLTVEVNHPGRLVQFAYDERDRITTITDFVGRTWRYSYDDFGDLVAVTSPGTAQFPDGVTIRYEYNSSVESRPLQHNMTRFFDPCGRCIVENEYGREMGMLQLNRVIRQRVAGGEYIFEYERVRNEFDFEYTDAERPTIQVNQLDPNGHNLHYVYNKFGNLLLTEEYILENGVERLIQTRARYNADGALIALHMPEGSVTQYYYGRDHFRALRNITDAEVQSHDDLTETERRGFRNLLGVVRRANPIPIQTLTFPRGFWGEYLALITDLPDADDVVVKYTYEAEYNQILTSSDPRFTRSADPNFPEGPDYDRTLTRYHYSGPPGDPTLLISQIEYPDMTLPDGTTLPGITDDFLLYDHRGRLSEQRDREGVITRFEYFGSGSGTVEGFMESVTLDPGGLNRTTRYELNERGLLKALHHPRSVGAPPGLFISRFVLDELDQIVEKEVSAPFGHKTRSIYDESGLVVRLEQDLVDETGAPVHGGKTVQIFRYDDTGELISKSIGGSDESSHLVMSYEYGRSGELLSALTPAGRKATFEYDERMNVAASTRGAGTDLATTARVEHDSDGRISAHITPLGHRTSYTYDMLGRITSVEDPLGSILRLNYDKSDNVLVERFFERKDDGFVLLRRSEYAYDEHENRIREVVNEFADPLPVTDLDTAHLASPGPGIARVTEYFYDRKDRLVRMVNPAIEQTLMEYDAADGVTATEDPLGNRLEQKFDAQGNVIRTVRRELIRDPGTGMVIRQEVFPQDFQYDELDRLVERKDSLGNTVRYAHDSRSQVVRVEDQLGNISRCLYDAFGRKVSDIREQTDTGLEGGQPLAPVVTAHEYDEDGSITAIIDGNGNRMEQQFDVLGQRTSVVYADGTSSRSEFDADGKLISTVDANGVRRNLKYDALGRLIRVDVDRSGLPAGMTVGGEDFERYGYDGDGNVLLEENNFCRIESRVNSLGQRFEEVLNISTPGLTLPFTVAREYDAAGRCSRTTYPSGRIIDYSRDLAGRVVSVMNAAKGNAYQGSAAFSDQYQILSRTLHGLRAGVLTYGNGATSSFSYDASGRPIELRIRDGGGTSLLVLQQLYDAAGNVRFRNHLQGGQPEAQLLKYDSIARLTIISGENGRAPFNPDDFAPLQFEPPGAIPDGQISVDAKIGPLEQDVNALTFRYDNAANRLEEHREGQQPISYVNVLNEYIAVDARTLLYDSNGNLQNDGTFSYVYDSRNLLVAATELSSGTTLEFLHDPRGRRIAELRTGSVTHLIYDDLNLIEEYENTTPVWQYVHTCDLDAFCQITGNGSELWCHTDQLGSPLIITDQAGAEAGSARYDPYGLIIANAGVLIPIGFAGRRLDAALGLYDFRSREYSPALGRFLQRDSLGLTISANLYQYALDNPLRYLDPFGTEPGWLRKTLSRFAGAVTGALKSFGNFLRLGLWDSWAQSFSSSSRQRINGAQKWFGEVYEAVDDGRFIDWVGEGAKARMKAIVEAEEHGDHFGSGEVFGDSAFTAYGIYKGASGVVRGGLRFGGNVRTYGFVEATKGVGYSIRHWSTNYQGVGLTRAAIAEAKFSTQRGSPYANYETYTASRTIARNVWQAERQIARGMHNNIRSVQVYRRFAGAPPRFAAKFYGTAVNRVVDAALARSADPFLSNGIIRQGAFGTNAKGNAMFPDYRLTLGNQTVIDITTVRQAGKVLQYPAGNAIEPYTGTVRYPEGVFVPTVTSYPDEENAEAGE